MDSFPRVSRNNVTFRSATNNKLPRINQELVAGKTLVSENTFARTRNLQETHLEECLESLKVSKRFRRFRFAVFRALQVKALVGRLGALGPNGDQRHGRPLKAAIGMNTWVSPLNLMFRP